MANLRRLYGWDFCRYDAWTGRTDCEVSGYCTWRGENDEEPGCGYTDIYGNCLI